MWREIVIDVRRAWHILFGAECGDRVCTGWTGSFRGSAAYGFADRHITPI
jgi:hypothetical protein